jgi:PPOX class probable F420-dependent enzyme
MEWSDVAVHLTGQAHIATVRPDGSPHVAKVWPAVDGDTIWIGTRTTSGKARNLRANPGAALMFEAQGEASVSGEAELVDDIHTKQRIWNSGIFPYPLAGFFGAPERDDFVFLRFRPGRAIVMTQGDEGVRRDTWRINDD